MVTIKLFLDGDGWMSETNDPKVIKLFGTGILPLPFLRGANAAEVLAVVSELNPDAVIAVEPEGK